MTDPYRTLAQLPDYSDLPPSWWKRHVTAPRVFWFRNCLALAVLAAGWNLDVTNGAAFLVLLATYLVQTTDYPEREYPPGLRFMRHP